jgi:hypothetical protein
MLTSWPLSTRTQRKWQQRPKDWLIATDAKRVEAEESLNAALDSLTKAEDKVRALELELERAKKAAYESGSKEAQDEMGRQLPRVCNEYYTDAWNDAIAVLNSGQTMLPPNPIKLPFPGATPPLHPEAVLNSPPPQLGAVMVDLEEVESAEAARQLMPVFMTLPMEEAQLRARPAQTTCSVFIFFFLQKYVKL